MKTVGSLTVTATIVIVMAMGSGVASATERLEPQHPGIAVEPTQALFGVATVAGDLVLSVSGPMGMVAQQTFKVGTKPTFSVVDQNGNTLPDGRYNYEIKLIPYVDDETAKILQAARESGDTGAVFRLRAENRIPSSGLVMSGSLSIVNGGFVAPDQEEPADDSSAARGLESIAKDVLHYDDAIITGSLCIGFDCANGESFGYDTLKLKENNLRMFFEDTSAGSFPSGDWRFRINDTTSGGGNYFAVEDGTSGRTPFRIETGSPNHSLYVEDYGRVGLGTSIPYVELHIVDGDTPTIRLDQDGTSGWTAQSWDVAGNETNFFIRDVTNGSKLPFRIFPGSESQSLEIRPTGVEVNVAFSAVSDVNKKTGLTPVDPTVALEKVAALPVTTWSFKADPAGATHLGPTAQDFYQIFDLGSDDRHIAPLDIAGVALAAIQGLNVKLEETDDSIQRDSEILKSENAMLNARLAEVEKQNAKLADRLAELERLLGSMSDPI
jgi:hypothetical protein